MLAAMSASLAPNPVLAQAAEDACPSLAPYYPDTYFATRYPNSESATATQWADLATTLGVIQSQCLRSSEYYALLGAAQMNGGQTATAAESLERALLLDPSNGAAQTDYASVLYASGQLFPALQLNESLLSREDLPNTLKQTLQERTARWRASTKQHDMVLDVSSGYDSNLNGAPDAGEITLTLSGESVLLNLATDFQAEEGLFNNLRLSSRHRTLTESGQRGWTNEVRGRISDDKQSDLLQFDSRYSLINVSRRRSLQWESSASTLHFGGNALYSAAQTRLRVQANSKNRCAPVADLATQYQRFHSQSALDAWETRAVAGLSCIDRDNDSNRVNRYGFEVGYIINHALSVERPGADRDGWQLSTRYQTQVFGGDLTAQASYTRLDDDRSYSPLLANGDRRWQKRGQFLVQHRKTVSLWNRSVLITTNLTHQNQDSNIELFDLNDTAIEVGLSIPL